MSLAYTVIDSASRPRPKPSP